MITDELQTKLDIITALASLYNSIHMVDLENDSAEEIKSYDLLRRFVNRKEEASLQMKTVMSFLAQEEWKERVLYFTDLTTLADRMGNKDNISLDFQGIHIWVRATFIAISRNAAGKVEKVLFVTRDIDNQMCDLQILQLKYRMDTLTGLLNRSAFYDDLKMLQRDGLPKNFVVVVVDANGLKNVNDTLGHAAGDEMLQGTAECLKQCMGNYGRIYRIGGDEFICLLDVHKGRLQRIQDDVSQVVEAWQGKLLTRLSLAVGYVARVDFPGKSYDELISIADKRMYDEKEKYYRNIGLDRAGRQLAYTAVCSSYKKILRVNLTDDSYKIVQMDINERTLEKGFDDRISSWLRLFAETGNVHSGDKAIYLQRTSLQYLREFIKNSKKNFALYYRRKINDVYKYVMMEIIPSPEYTDQNQIVYLYVKDIDNHIV